MSTNSTLAHLDDLGGACGFLDEIREVFTALPLFDGFTPDDHEALCDYMTCYAAPSRKMVLNEGSAGDFLIIILTGSVNVLKNDVHGRQQILARVGPGGFIGELSLVDGSRRFASCMTIEPTDLAVLTRTELARLMDERPALGNKVLLLLLQLVASRLRETTTQMMLTVLTDQN
jgi:CRP-like cAMP-binding protein